MSITVASLATLDHGIARYPDRIRRKAIELYKNGVSSTAIAKELGIGCSQTVRHWVINDGIKVSGLRSRYTVVQKEHVEKMLRNGVMHPLIAETCGVRIGTVKAWAHELRKKTEPIECKAEPAKNLMQSTAPSTIPESDIDHLREENGALRKALYYALRNQVA